jgi:outer membrane immunogenic protein
MRSLILGAAGAIFFLPPVQAADIYGPYAPIFPWTGFYLGANGGGGAASRTASFTPNDANVQAITCGGASGGTCPGPVTVNLGGGVGGLQFGYNWQWGNWLAGFETDFAGSGVTGKKGSDFMLGRASSKLEVSEDLDWFGTVRVRIGPKLSANVLTYVTGGLAYGSVHENARLNSEAGAGATSGGFAFSCTAGPNCFAGSASRTAMGWSAGTGLEYSFWTNLSLKIEYLFVDLGSGRTVNAIAQTGGGGAIPSSFAAGINENDFHIFRFGLNYQFNQCCEPLK